MSDNRPTYDSSSSDEEPSNHFHIQLPQRQLNLQEIRKQNYKKHEKPTIAKQTASNLAKAKKITAGSNHKFGNNNDKHLGNSSAATNRRSLISPTSSTHVSSDDDDEDDDSPFHDGQFNDDKNLNVFDNTKNNLSHFQFNADGIKPKSLHGQGDDSSDDDGNGIGDIEDETHSDFAVLNQNHPPQQYYETDSSDEDEEEEEENNKVPKTVHKTYSNASSGRSSNISRKKSMSETTDTRAPISPRMPSMGRRSTSSNRSKESTGRRSTTSGDTNISGSGGRLKGILRKMSLVDSTPVDSMNQDISHSDTFLGRVLNFGTNQGLSGGGLAPGASRVIKEEDERGWNLDEERRVGFAAHENDRDAFEMQPLNFEDLSEEAKQLIQQHVPGAGTNSLSHSQQSSAAPSTEISPSQSPSQHLLNEKINNNKNNKQSTAAESSSLSSSPGVDEELAQRRASEERKKAENPFYTPNPDLFLRGANPNNQELHQAPNDFLHDMDGDYIAPPKQVQAGVLSSLLRLYQNPQEQKSASSLSRVSTGTTGTASIDDSYDSDDYKDFKSSLNVDLQHKLKLGIKGGSKAMFNKAAQKLKHHSHTRTNTVETQGSSNLEEFSNDKFELSNGNDDENVMNTNLPSFQNARPKMPKRKTTEPVQKLKKLRHKQRAERLRITVHIADILQRQRFIMNMCRALMLFGAPTHRLEEYMVMTSRVLEIDGQFIYFPGCMLISFGDAATRTSEVHLVRCAQGINLSKLADTHKIYKSVIHDLIGVEDASKKLDDLLKSKSRYPPWLCVFFYGLGSLAVTPFAFEGGWLDLPISFGVGLCVGYLQFYVSSISNLYSSVFEVSAAIVVAFIARGIGSIKGGKLFCFLAIAQGSLAIILPGYIILCGSLELQSRNLVAGAVRMFYAIIYSLFLGFGITLGAALYGWIDHNATSANSCPVGHGIRDEWRILFVPMFALCLGLINQARWNQVPIMIVIAGIGYIGSYYAGKHFATVTEFTACIGAFIVGVLGNLYSRIWKGMAVSAMLPAIFVQVPSGIASKSSLISGLNTADQITNKSSSNGGGTVTTDASSLSFGATMVEVSIGISVGLFAAALIIYPFGKKRTGLFAL